LIFYILCIPLFVLGKFHVVAHDQGARVAWHAIAMGAGRERFLSFSPLSIPHADVFSNALLSTDAVPADADPDQQQASQYVRQLTLPNSTTFDTGEVWDVDCPGFATPADCQKTLWWYNGAIDAGAMALAPSMPYEKNSVAASIGIPLEMVEDSTQYPLEGVPQSVFVGNISEFPVFFGCGTQDTCDLCKLSFSEENNALIETYTFLKKDQCGHNVLGCAFAQEYIDGIVANVQSVYA
jgi:pimeloyl-ACP methyl ester carboxylesterase